MQISYQPRDHPGCRQLALRTLHKWQPAPSRPCEMCPREGAAPASCSRAPHIEDNGSSPMYTLQSGLGSQARKRAGDTTHHCFVSFESHGPTRSSPDLPRPHTLVIQPECAPPQPIAMTRSPFRVTAAKDAISLGLKNESVVPWPSRPRAPYPHEYTMPVSAPPTCGTQGTLVG